jgi:hypothetical protein
MFIHEPVATTPTLHALQEPVTRVLAYYDMFRYPLTTEEIYTFLPSGDVGELELEEALDEMAAEGAIGRSRGYHYLPHQTSDVVDRRVRMEKEGERMWEIARLVGGILRHVPFVRGIFISGQLCRYIADEESDIDYFIVTTPERLWIVRTAFVIARRLLLLNSRKYFCTNYFVTTANLAVRERNEYAACEVASTKPLYNMELFERYMGENSWLNDYYPHFDLSRIEIRRGVEGTSRLQRVAERLVPARLADRLDRWLMERTREFWRRKFPDRPAETYEVSLRSCRDESRAAAAA